MEALLQALLSYLISLAANERTQLGNPMQAAAAHHVHGRVVAKGAIQDHMGECNRAADHLKLFVHHGLDALQLR